MTSENLFQTLFLLQREANGDMIITGSCALYAHGLVKSMSEVEDIDIITSKYIDFSSIGAVTRFPQTYLDKSMSVLLYNTGIKVDVIIDNTRQYSTKEIHGIAFKTSDIDIIMVKKFESLALFGNIKHGDILIKYIQSNMKQIQLPV